MGFRSSSTEEKKQVDIIQDILMQLWADGFKLTRSPQELCPECLLQGLLTYMTPYHLRTLNRGKLVYYECKECGYKEEESRREE